MAELVLPETYSPSFHGDVGSHPYIKNLEYRRLGKTNLRVSQLSHGTGFGNGYGDYSRAEAIDTVHEGLKFGINYIDTSPWYGSSEDVLGEALKTVPRSVYYIGTKAGRNFTPGWEGRFDFSRSGILKNVESSLARLGVGCIDIIQIHDIEFASDPKQIVEETLPALESVVRAGKAKYIGITAYDINVLKTVAEQARVDTILTYCRYNLHDTSLNDFIPFFKEKDIGIINASPIAMGLLTEAGPATFHPANPELKALALKATELARQRGTSIDKVSLSFSLKPKEPTIATTLVGMPTRKQLKANMDIVTAPTTPKDEELFQEVRQFFRNQNHHWEGVEVAAMNKALQGQ
jgi:aryl-alcohol dehydrogenase-like predicted oxidoreductase